jgi:hypothetical protein
MSGARLSPIDRAPIKIQQINRKVQARKAEPFIIAAMDNVTFAHQMMTWLDPAEILRCCVRLQSDRDAALSEQVLMIGSRDLSHGSEAHFDQLVMKLLRGFEFPTEVLRLLAAIQKDFPFTDEDLTWLANLEFNGGIQVASKAQPIAGRPAHTILLVRERDVVLDLLRDPIMALLEMVWRGALHWRKFANLEARVYLESSSPTPLFSYIERQVAQYYIDLEPRPHITGMQGPNVRYRAITAFGVSSSDAKMIEIMREAAAQQARSTWEPVGNL